MGNEIDTGRVGVEEDGEETAGTEMAQRDKNSLGGSAAEMLRTPGDGQTQHHSNFHFSVRNPR